MRLCASLQFDYCWNGYLSELQADRRFAPVAGNGTSSSLIAWLLLRQAFTQCLASPAVAASPCASWELLAPLKHTYRRERLCAARCELPAGRNPRPETAPAASAPPPGRSGAGRNTELVPQLGSDLPLLVSDTNRAGERPSREVLYGPSAIRSHFGDHWSGFACFSIFIFLVDCCDPRAVQTSSCGRMSSGAMKRLMMSFETKLDAAEAIGEAVQTELSKVPG